MREFLVRHPWVVPAVIATAAGVTAYRTFQVGAAFADLRRAVAEDARAASEALGG